MIYSVKLETLFNKIELKLAHVLSVLDNTYMVADPTTYREGYS